MPPSTVGVGGAEVALGGVDCARSGVDCRSGEGVGCLGERMGGVGDGVRCLGSFLLLGGGDREGSLGGGGGVRRGEGERLHSESSSPWEVSFSLSEYPVRGLLSSVKLPFRFLSLFVFFLCFFFL